MSPTASRPMMPLDILHPSDPVGIAVATIAILIFLSVVGFGWSKTVTDDRLLSFALAPAVGTAAMILATIAAERLGTPLTGAIGPAIVSVVAGGGGYVARFVLERKTPSQSTS